MIYVLTETYRQATNYGKDMGFAIAAVKHIHQPHQLLGLHKAEIHVLPEARELHNYDSLIRRALNGKATLVYAEEA